MIDGLKSYAEMKDSGVEWLGDVPAHWDIVPAFVAYRPRDVRNTGMAEKTVLSLSYGRIVIKPEEKLRGLVPESFETYQIVEPGNIIVRTTDLQNDRNSLRIGHAKDRGIITSAYLCLETTSQVENEFGYQYLNAYDLLKIIYGYGSGLRQNLDFKDIKRMPVLLPPKDEQAAIVRFLDHADRRIRRAIAAKQKLIRLLEEQKRAIIHRAVTRGLDPDVRLKPSGIKWLGDIPSHWGIERLSHVANFRSGKAHENHVDESGAYFCVNARFVSTDGRSAKRCAANFCPARKADVLMVMSDLPNGRALARAFFTPEDDLYAVNQRVCALTAFGVEPKFLFYFANRNVQLLQHDDGSNQTHLSNYDFKTMRVLVPPMSEQLDIVAQLDRLVRSIDEESGKAAKEIDLLREYRIRLVTDVVTGKLDVREAATTLTEMIELSDSDFDSEEENEEESMEAGAAEDQAA